MNYSLASTSWNKSEISSIKKVIKSNNFTMGKNTYLFERMFKNFHRKKYGIMVNSGSSANLLMVAAMMYFSKKKIEPGDEVIVPAVSWSTTFFPLQQYGIKLVFVDVSIDTFNIDPKKIENAITKKTKAIFAVNLYGNPCNFEQILKICRKNKLILLEDNCESLGARYKKKLAGTFGIMSSFSFFFSHHISTMEGGMILTDNKELYQILLCLRAHGWTRSLPKNNLISGKKSKDLFYDLFNFVLPGYNVRPLEISAAIGLEQLKKLNNIIKVRRKNALYFYKKMSKFKNLKLQIENGDSSWFNFGIIYKGSRKKLIKKLVSKKIEYRPIVTGNFTKNLAIKYFKYRISGNLNNANIIHNKGISFGNSHLNLKKQINLLETVFSEI